ncbi:MAG: NAD(P)-dependent oxidoreductase [bacterium]
MTGKIVITGSESFIGQELKDHCRAKGIGFLGLDTVPGSGADYRQLDIRSAEVEQAIPEQAEALIHLAAISRDQDCRRDLTTAFDVNVQGTINLIKAAQNRHVKQFIFASSEWVYGGVQPGVLQKEDDPVDITRMTSEYAITKILGERLLALTHQRGLCPVTVLRFGIVYGPRAKPGNFLEGLFNEVRTLDTIDVKGSLESGRRFVHVSDISEGILSALGRPGYEVINLTGDTVVTMREIIQTSARLLGRNPRVMESDPKAINLRNPDNSKARNLLGWQPKIGLEQGLTTLRAFHEGGK